MRKLWGGAFDEGSADLVDQFGQSIDSDLRFWREDVEGSIAHARMLGHVGILSNDESAELIQGLESILESGPESLPRDVEDIHTAIEVRLGEIVGPVAAKLHTARSRNDQVATDAKLYTRRRLAETAHRTAELQTTLLNLAECHRDTIMPGYTHQQPAQPITLGFHLMAHFWAFDRHRRRLACGVFDLETCPLGSAALAGTSFAIDRTMTSTELGFERPTPNALDATSDRSWLLDALHICAQIGIDLSRLSQELVLWSGREFGFLRLADRVTTGSSIMPQKRNPDMAELIRGRSSRLIANWTAVATTMKALPLGYNRDTQDDKPPLFESLDLVAASLRLASLMLEGVTWNTARMREMAGQGFSTATDVADFLASNGVPFRVAHEAVGAAVRACGDDWSREPFIQALSAFVSPDLAARAWDRTSVERSAASRESEGGAGPLALEKQFELARATLNCT